MPSFHSLPLPLSLCFPLTLSLYLCLRFYLCFFLSPFRSLSLYLLSSFLSLLFSVSLSRSPSTFSVRFYLCFSLSPFHSLPLPLCSILYLLLSVLLSLSPYTFVFPPVCGPLSAFIWTCHPLSLSDTLVHSLRSSDPVFLSHSLSLVHSAFIRLCIPLYLFLIISLRLSVIKSLVIEQALIKPFSN